jgi:hypothetical protein
LTAARSAGIIRRNNGFHYYFTAFPEQSTDRSGSPPLKIAPCS